MDRECFVLAQDDVVDGVEGGGVVGDHRGISDGEEAETEVLEESLSPVDEDELEVGVELVHLDEALDVDVVLGHEALLRCPSAGRGGSAWTRSLLPDSRLRSRSPPRSLCCRCPTVSPSTLSAGGKI